MWKIVRNICGLFGAIALLQSCVSSNDSKVDVTLYSKNKSIESTIQIEKGSEGQKYIRISLTNSGWLFTDLGSTNGSWLDRKRLEAPVKLKPGLTIRIGRTSLRFEK